MVSNLRYMFLYQTNPGVPRDTLDVSGIKQMNQTTVQTNCLYSRLPLIPKTSAFQELVSYVFDSQKRTTFLQEQILYQCLSLYEGCVSLYETRLCVTL